MEVQNESIPCLFASLGELFYDSSDPKNYILQPLATKLRFKQKLRKKIFETLFQHLKGPHRAHGNLSQNKLAFTEEELIYTHCFDLRSQHQFDQANRLEGLLNKLIKESVGDEYKTLLRLLLRLSNTVPKQQTNKLVPKIPVLYPDKSQPCVAPSGPLLYGDTAVVKFNSVDFMNYPSSVFEIDGSQKFEDITLQNSELDVKIFEMEPGTNLVGNGLFSQAIVPPDSFQGESRHSLFGALVQSKTSGIDFLLDIPDIPENCTGLDVRIPKLQESLEDEGFVDTMSLSTASMCTVSPDMFNLKPEEDMWDVALRTKRQKHYTWEHIGVIPQPQEKPFLTEAPSEVFDNLLSVMNGSLKIIDPCLHIPETKFISMAELVVDVLNLLIGVPSNTFIYDTDKGDFVLMEGLTLTGVSPEGLRSLCGEFLEAGSSYHKLTEFSKPPNIDSFYRAGLIYQAFTGAVRKYLQYYRGCILSFMGEDKTLMQIKLALMDILAQIVYLCMLCKRNTGRTPDEGDDEEFPTGVKLLSYLYKEALELSSTHYYPMILSLLNTSCGPYVMFVQEWVFHGVCRDLYGEFMVHVRDDYLRFRNKMYWTHGYLMITKNVIDSVPLFLLGMTNDIFVCGKSINLLRLCNPQHFLFAMESDVPRMMITFSEDDLTTMDKQCQRYHSKMHEIARQKVRSRAEMIRRAEEAKQELVIKARQAATKELERLKEEIVAVKEAEDKKKRQLFADLKQQMEKDLKRRASAREEEQEKDKLRMNEAVKHEVLETRVEEELEARARQELVEYYEKLSDEATARERRALWRVRRRQLDIERIQFLQLDEATLAEELENKPLVPQVKKADDSPKDVTDIEFRQWTNEGEGPIDDPDNGPLEENGPAGKLNPTELPQWAKDGLKNPSPAFGYEPSNGNELPKWAKTEPGEEPREVADVAENNAPRTKSHPSQSSMQDVLKTQGHDSKSDWTDSKTEDEVGYRHVQTKGKTFKQHPSESTVSDLMYTEPESKEDRLKREKSDSLKKQSKLDGSGENIDTVAHKKDISKDEEQASSSVVETPPSVSLTGDGDSNGEFSAADVEDMVFRKTGVKKNIGPLSVAGSQPKTHVKLIPHINKDVSPEKAAKPLVKVSESTHVSIESVADSEQKVSIKKSETMSATTESDETYETKTPHVRMVSGMSSTQQSEPQDEPRVHLKTVADKHSSMESQNIEEKPHLKINRLHNATKESVPEPPKPVRQSVFGHISQLSRYEMDAVFAPKLKSVPGHHASDESAPDERFDRGFLVKAGKRKTVEGQGASRETEETDGADYRPKIRISEERNAWVESELVDTDALRLEKFKKRNVFGHSSRSTVESLLYGPGYGTGKEQLEDKNMGEVEKTDIEVWIDDLLDSYQSDFGQLDEPPAIDLLANYTQNTYSGFGDYGIHAAGDIAAHEFVPLSSILKRSITAPIVAQVSVVNQCIVNYFMSDLEVEKHLVAIRRFVFMQDGEFGQCLSDQLFEKLATSPTAADLLNPMYLNNVLSKALRSSLHGDGECAKNISFALKFRPKTVAPNAHDALDCLQLTYKVDWPLNIIITEGSMATYCRVFSFKLQLRRVVWVLSDIWHKLKRDAIIQKASNGAQFRKLQLHRHEMQHFVKVMQEYMSNQIIHVSWKEFQDDLTNRVKNLDDLHEVHRVYLNKCLSRCLLNKKAATVMKIIQDIFGLILKFRMQLISNSWVLDESTNQVQHPLFNKLCATYKSFKDYSKFLFTVVNKLAMRGYQPHLQELVLRLNYNNYYRADSTN